jgi:hypothetical protein
MCSLSEKSEGSVAIDIMEPCKELVERLASSGRSKLVTITPSCLRNSNAQVLTIETIVTIGGGSYLQWNPKKETAQRSWIEIESLC